MKSKWKILALFSAAAVLIPAYQWGIPAVINSQLKKDFLELKIQENTGIKVDLGQPEISMGSFPSIWIKSNYISVLNKDNSKPLNIENPKIKIKLLPLLFKKVDIDKIDAKSEKLDLKLSENKELYIGNYPINFKRNNEQFTLSSVNLNLGEFNINLDDRLNNQKVSLNGLYLKNASYKKDSKLQFSTKGEFVVNKRFTPFSADVELDLPLNNFSNDKLKLNANIKDLDLASISDYVNILTNGIIKDLKGVLNLNAKTTQSKDGHKTIHSSLSTIGLEISGQDKISSIIHKDKLKLNMNFKTIAGGILFKDTVLDGKNFNFSLNGKLSASGKKIPAMDLVVKVAPSQLENLCAILPWFKEIPKEMNFYKFKEYGAFGTGHGELHFIGTGDRPEVFGNIKLSNVYTLRKGLIAPEGASVNMDFVGEKMNIEVYVPTLYNQFVTVKGFAKIDGSKYSELDIDSSDSVDLDSAEKVLNPLHEMLQFKIGPVPIMNIKGIGSLHVQSKGKKVDPHIWGKMNFRNATASFKEIHNLELKNASGEIVFDNTNITFKTLGGTINNRPASISGKCNVMGNLDVIAETKGQNIPDMIKVINTSKDMKDVQRVVKPFTNPDGNGDLFLNIYGNAPDVAKVVFNKDLFAKGKITFHNASTLLKNTHIPFKNINGYVNFDKKNASYDLTGFINNSKIHVSGDAHDKDIDLTAKSEKFKIIDMLDMMHPEMNIPLKKEIGNIFVDFTGKYKGIADTDNIDYNKITAYGKIHPNTKSSNPLKVNNGDFNIKSGIMHGNNISGTLENNPYTLSFTGTDIYKSMKIRDAVFNFDNFDISSLNNIKNLVEIPAEYKPFVDNITDIDGNIDINGYIKNGGVYTDTDLRNIRFKYAPLDANVKIISGRANMRGDKLYLSKINSAVSSMPVYINGNIANIFSNPNLNLYMAGKLNQEFFDKFINTKSVYPAKLKGDASIISKIQGNKNNLHVNTSLNVAENSSIYYMGATLTGAPSGITSNDSISTNPVSLNLNANLYPNSIKINSFDYNQTLLSQNKKSTEQNQLSVSGVIQLLKNNIVKFNNLKIKTSAPTDAKIFNILLKKPTIKQGIFTTDMVLNGTSDSPKAIGELNISSIDIPLFEATIKDINLDFQKDFIYLTSRGIILTNDINLLLKIVNDTKRPYVIEDMQVQTDELNLNIIANRFNDYDTDKLRSNHQNDNTLAIDPSDIILKNGNITADKILIKKAQATDFNTKLRITNDNILHIDNYKFDLANGQIDGNIQSNLKTKESTANMNIKNADAEIIGEKFFDLYGQMYGNITGDLTVNCKGYSGVECLNTLSGKGKFEVTDGRMPKLGSLEYLLKAANLVTGGITGVSINGIIDLITPLKTGNFSKINGDVKVQNGVATDINVYSHGKELNMYLTGMYDLSTLVADMEVYGSLSKNFSTLLGRIGNASLNRLFNSIPGININEIRPETTSNINKIPDFNIDNTLRVFKAEIFGDINGSNYVKSFKWIKH